MAVSERLSLCNRPIELRENFFGRERNSQWKIAARQAFSDDEQIWNYRLVLDREHPAGSAKPRHDFIDDKQGAAAIAPFPHHAQRPGRPKFHSSSALNQRFDDDR